MFELIQYYYYNITQYNTDTKDALRGRSLLIQYLPVVSPPWQPLTWTYTRTRCVSITLTHPETYNRNKHFQILHILRELQTFTLSLLFSVYWISILASWKNIVASWVELTADSGSVYRTGSPRADVPLTCHILDHYLRLHELLFFFSQRHTANRLVQITGLSSLVSWSVE